MKPPYTAAACIDSTQNFFLRIINSSEDTFASLNQSYYCRYLLFLFLLVYLLFDIQRQCQLPYFVR